MENSGVTCCLCNGSIIVTFLDPCDLTIKISGGDIKEKQQDQFFWCHINCFNKILHPSARQWFILPFVEDEEEA